MDERLCLQPHGDLPMSRSSVVGRLRGQEGVTLMELLVGMIIMAILSTMLYLTWFTLNDSFAYSVRSSEARDNARQAMTRMVMELRDAQSRAGYAPVQSAGLNTVIFSTTFNEVGNLDQALVPRLVRYQYFAATGTIVRTVDSDGNGSLTNNTGQVILSNLVNNTKASTMFGTAYAQTPVFIYSYYDASGTLVHTSNLSSVASTMSIVDVTIRILVDLNPGKSPTFMDLQSTVQPRNGRWGT